MQRFEPLARVPHTGEHLADDAGLKSSRLSGQGRGGIWKNLHLRDLESTRFGGEPHRISDRPDFQKAAAPLASVSDQAIEIGLGGLAHRPRFSGGIRRLGEGRERFIARLRVQEAEIALGAADEAIFPNRKKIMEAMPFTDGTTDHRTFPLRERDIALSREIHATMPVWDGESGDDWRQSIQAPAMSRTRPAPLSQSA